MATSSVSKGCFVFKPSAKKRKITETEEYFTRGCEEKDGSALRYKLCRDLWDQVIRDTQGLQEELSRQTLDRLLDFTKKCFSADGEIPPRSTEIPTAALLLGVNVPDHDMTFQSLSDLLRRRVTPYVASVQAKECGALKHLLKRVLERIMDGVVAVDGEEDDETDAPQIGKGVQCSFGILCEWYKAKLKSKDGSPEKQNGANPPVVVIFKDLEAFNPKVLQDFILICSRYVDQMPLMFIFGIATSPSTIQSMFPHSVSALLCIELIHSLSCTQHLATVIDKFILTAKFPFKLTSKVMQVLISIFLYHDFSVRNFIKGVQVALLEHFHSQPLSVLCCEKKVALDLVARLRPKDLERIRQLPSFRSHVETLNERERAELMNDDAILKTECKKFIKSLHKYHKNYFPILKCLHTLTSSLPRYPLGKQIRELHLICLENRVWENEDYRTAMKLLRMFSKDELVPALQRCVDILEPEESKTMMKVRIQLQELVSKMKGLDLCAEVCPPAQKKTDLFHLQKALLQMHETRRNKQLSPYERLRNETVDLVESLVRAYLAPPESQPLNEVLYYRSSTTVRRHLNAAPRTSIQAALSDPYFYLQNENLRAEDGGVPNSAPDICIAYKLHLECGRLINLLDWLEAYCTVVSAAEGADPGAEDFGKVDEVRHARFIQAVSELEFLGFLKSTKQKTDHVARLTWGGC
uniref:Origin recognition complex subunit 3 n=1 Tax=Periophthalmus magnuspinnatus TaxID=409849 RepID=A0A3B3Z9U9_9GOBI